MLLATLVCQAILASAVLASPTLGTRDSVGFRSQKRTDNALDPLSVVNSVGLEASEVVGLANSGLAGLSTVLPALATAVQAAVQAAVSSQPTPNVVHSANMAGAVLNGNSGSVTSVSGEFTVPGASGTSPTDASGTTIWVGIDGVDNQCQNYFRAGCNVAVQGDGPATFTAWSWWSPSSLTIYDSFSVNAGDSIGVNVSTVGDSSGTSGTISIENFSTGQTASSSFSGQQPLCGTHAAWMVQRDEFASDAGGFSLAPMANFDLVSIANANALVGGSMVGPGEGATLYTMFGPDMATVMSNCSLSANSVQCSSSSLLV